MKKKELENIKNEKRETLVKKVSELKKKIRMDYMKIRVGQEANLKVVKNARRDLAQILTVLGQKGKGVEKEA